VVPAAPTATQNLVVGHEIESADTPIEIGGDQLFPLKTKPCPCGTRSSTAAQKLAAGHETAARSNPEVGPDDHFPPRKRYVTPLVPRSSLAPTAAQDPPGAHETAARPPASSITTGEDHAVAPLTPTPLLPFAPTATHR